MGKAPGLSVHVCPSAWRRGFGVARQETAVTVELKAKESVEGLRQRRSFCSLRASPDPSSSRPVEPQRYTFIDSLLHINSVIVI